MNPVNCPNDLASVAQPCVLHVSGLCFAYGQQVLFDKLTLCCVPGLTLVLGGDGSGKTTLLRLLAGDLPASAGLLQVGGVDVHGALQRDQPQVFWVDPRTTAFDQLTARTYFSQTAQRFADFDANLLDELVAGLTLEAHLDKAIYMLSTGTKRKVWLAAAFASGAAVTLLDEPFAALDKPSIALVMELLEDAASHVRRAFVLADYTAPGDVPLAQTVVLG
jgi:ABC-type multidrug transport system ATPase subunit